MWNDREGTIKSSHTVKVMIVLVIEAFVNEIENFDNQKLTT